MNTKKILPYVLLIVIALVALTLKNCKSTSPKPKTTTVTEDSYVKRGLNRNPSNVNYSKHAKCRMDCRHITEAEVKYILQNGNVNYKKSDLKGEDCRKKYAVEGYSKDGQHLRIVFAPCKDEVTVVTCIDIGTEWECYCEGDEAK